MKYWVIDRFEGEYAVCEDEEQRTFALKRAALPSEAGEGWVLAVLEDGTLYPDLEETQRRRQRIAEKQRRAFGG